MCSDSPDPRDAVSEAYQALLGLMLLVSGQRDDTVDAEGLACLLRFIVERLAPVDARLLDYVPRDWHPGL